MVQIDRHRLDCLLAREQERLETGHPRARDLAMRAREHLSGGGPMPWIVSCKHFRCGNSAV